MTDQEKGIFAKYYKEILNEASRKAGTLQKLSERLGVDYSTLTRNYNDIRPNVINYDKLLSFLCFEDKQKMEKEESIKRIKFWVNKYFVKCGKSITTMASKLGVDKGNVHRWINGENMPNAYYFEKIIESLYVFENNRPKNNYFEYDSRPICKNFISYIPVINNEFSFSEYFELLKFLEENFPSKN